MRSRSARPPTPRIGRAGLTIAALAASALVVGSFALGRVVKLNLTASMPIGLYAVRPSASAIPRGAIVIACPPPEAQRIGVANGYLAPARGLVADSRCSSGSAPLLKYAVAFAGDEIDISAHGLSVNGHLLDPHTPSRIDRDGRALGAVPNGHYRLRKDQVWLYSPAIYSWDSRYFGPAKLGDVLGVAAPLWTSTPLVSLHAPDHRT